MSCGEYVTLFLVPFVVLLMAEGLGRIYSLWVKWNRTAALLVYGSIALIILWIPFTESFHNAITPPLGEHIKPVLAYVQAHMQKNDAIYVYSGSATPFRYYAASYKLNTVNTIVAENSPGVKRFTKDVKSFKEQKRIWFIFSHVIGCDNCEIDKVQFHIQILDNYGIQLDRFEAPGAFVYLYHLNP
jgi:hypothetical protein